STGSVSRTLGHVKGNLQKFISAGSAIARTFELGDATNATYTPVLITFANVGEASELLASSTLGDHNLSGSIFNAVKTVNRYWTITVPVSSTLSFDTYDAEF